MEPRTSWEKLVAIHADGKEICNCGNAYYSHCAGKDSRCCGHDGRAHTYCAAGCSSNQIRAREEIADKLIAGMN